MRGQTALGIDISDSRITLALLRKAGNKVELLKSACAAVPDGAIKNGSIEDAAALAKAIKELKSRNKIRTRQAAVSLPAKDVLVQIMDIPKQLPANMGQYVQNEVKHYVILPGKEIAMDFCGVGSAGQKKNRLFVAAADREKVAGLVKTFGQAGLNVVAIEPAMLSYIRALYDKTIAGRFDYNVLMAILGGGVLTLCVFRKQTIDFVRTRNISKEKAAPNEICQWLADQVNAIIQFYSVEVADSSGKWEITIVFKDSVQLPDNAEGFLKSNVSTGTLQVRSGENAHQDTAVGQSSHIGADRPSTVAIGLAMRILGEDKTDLRINLVPAETAEVKSLKKDTLITANIAAVILLLMILAVGALSRTIGRVRNSTHQKQMGMSRHTCALLIEQKSVEGRIGQITDRFELMNRILSSRHDLEWFNILNDIAKATPRTVRLTSLSSEDGSGITLEGLALSYEATRLFVNMLNKSKHINSASLIETERNDEDGGLVRYEINCSLVAAGGK
jgi:Tfp pilus assembly protein PilN/nucleoside diphosphate kinase